MFDQRRRVKRTANSRSSASVSRKVDWFAHCHKVTRVGFQTIEKGAKGETKIRICKNKRSA